MSRDELVSHLRYLISKYISVGGRDDFENFLLIEDVPVKGFLAKFNQLTIGPIEDVDGDLIRNIYFHFC